jgi:hypothetical protein
MVSIEDLEKQRDKMDDRLQSLQHQIELLESELTDINYNIALRRENREDKDSTMTRNKQYSKIAELLKRANESYEERIVRPGERIRVLIYAPENQNEEWNVSLQTSDDEQYFDIPDASTKDLDLVIAELHNYFEPSTIFAVIDDQEYSDIPTIDSIINAPGVSDSFERASISGELKKEITY